MKKIYDQHIIKNCPLLAQCLGMVPESSEVEQYLQKKQSKKEFKDTGKRTGYSRKERAAYGVLLKKSDIDNIEKDQATAVEIVVKKRVWLPIDPENEKLNGVDSGAAFLKDKIQKAYPAKPLKNTAIHRRIYIEIAEAIRDIMIDCKTIEDLGNNLPSLTALYNAFIVPAANKPSIKYPYFKGYFEEYISKEFYNLYNRSWHNSDATKKTYELAIMYSGQTEEKAKINYDKLAEQIDKSNQRSKEHIDRLDKISSVDQLKDYHKNHLALRGGYIDDYYKEGIKTGNFKLYQNYLIDYYEKNINNSKEQLKPEKLPWRCKVSEPDWSWAKIERKKAEKDDTKITINTGKPLDYIKRTGGIEILEVNETVILKNLGFAGVTIGNYVKDEEAREHLRHFIGALADLCEILNYDQFVINKPLSIGFGAYGRGGKAMATYYPTLKAINLTKRRGDGTVAHEWGHYLDAFVSNFNTEYFLLSIWANKVISAEISNSYIPYYERKKYSGANAQYYIEILRKVFQNQSDPVKIAMLKLFIDIKFGIDFTDIEDATAYFNAEKRTDYFYSCSTYGNSKYWASPEELFARAFETYVFDKLQNLGRENNYLVSGGYFNSLVYPKGDERIRFNKHYENLINIVRTQKNISDFKPWTNKRSDEYIVLNDNKQDSEVKTGVIVSSTNDNDKAKRIRIAKARAIAELEMLNLLNL